MTQIRQFIIKAARMVRNMTVANSKREALLRSSEYLFDEYLRRE